MLSHPKRRSFRPGAFDVPLGTRLTERRELRAPPCFGERFVGEITHVEASVAIEAARKELPAPFGLASSDQRRLAVKRQGVNLVHVGLDLGDHGLHTLALLTVVKDIRDVIKAKYLSALRPDRADNPHVSHHVVEEAGLHPCDLDKLALIGIVE